MQITKKSVFSAIIVLYLVFAPSILFKQVKLQAEYLNRENKINYHGIIELWNIDTFEGGSVSRALWLERRAVEFEKKNAGTFILVRNMTIEQAIINLQNGNKPNLISYGIGFGSYILSELVSYTGKINVRDDLLKGGTVNGSIMAVPYILGGYTLIGNDILMQKIGEQENLLNSVYNLQVKQYKNTIPPLSFAGNTNNNALLSLYFNTNEVAKDEHFSVDSFLLDQYEAYESFVLKNSSTAYLCTQRDAYRCKNRESNHIDEAYQYVYLGGFSDLIQYMSILDADNKTKKMCESFIEFLTSEKSQRTLTNIAMFSVLDMHIYSDIFYKEWEKVLLNPLKTFSVFLEKEVIKNHIEVTYNALKGNESAKEQINSWF